MSRFYKSAKGGSMSLAKSSRVENTREGSFQIVYWHNDRRIATAPFNTFEGGAAQIRRLMSKGRILGEPISLLGQLRRYCCDGGRPHVHR